MNEVNEVVGVNEVVVGIDALHEGAKMKDVIEKINELVEKVNSINVTKRDRGPTSTKEMTDEDARKAMVGEFKDKSHKEAATLLGLSYGQIYSARKGYTFKAIYQEMVKSQKSQ